MAKQKHNSRRTPYFRCWNVEEARRKDGYLIWRKRKNKLAKMARRLNR